MGGIRANSAAVALDRALVGALCEVERAAVRSSSASLAVDLAARLMHHEFWKRTAAGEYGEAKDE